MTVGIIGAMREEIAPLLEYFGDYEAKEIGANTYYTIIKDKHRICIAYSKIGKVHSALSASVMILHFGCQHIIFSGVAGALREDLKVGDLVLGSKLCQYDVDISAFGHELGFIPESKLYIKSNAALNLIAKKSASKLGISLKEGIIASGDMFVANADKKLWIIEKFHASAVEMEGAAVAVVCDALNVPFCVLRSISDSADGSADVSFDEFLEDSAKRSAKVVIEMCMML